MESEALIGNRTGIVRTLWEPPLHPADPVLSSYGCEYSLPSGLRTGLEETVAGGAGLSREEALGAAIGEAVERYCAAAGLLTERHLVGPTPFRRLADRAVHPSEFALYSEEQHSYREFPFPPLRENTSVRWTWARSLTRDSDILVPANLVFMPYRSIDGEHFISYPISTGLSCARDFERAVLLGLCEVVERDAFIILWRNRLSPPRLDPETGISSEFAKVWKGVFALPTLETRLYDLTADSGTRVVMAIMRDKQPPRLFTIGLAARPGLADAARKALVEATQGRMYVRQLMQAERQWEPGRRFENVSDFKYHAMLYSVRPDLLERLHFLDRGTIHSNIGSDGDTSADLDDLVRRLSDVGCEVIVKNLTTPDVEEAGFHVVRVIVPQMQPLHGDHRFPFLGGKRQYHATRVFPFAPRDLKEVKFNPLPHPCP